MTDGQYTVSIPIKPYSKRFLVLNYGEPADLSKNPRLNNLFRRFLKKPRYTFDKSHLKTISQKYYSEQVEIFISENDFYRYGWELSRTDTIAFNREIEELTKFLMRMTVSMYENLMMQRDAILRFQEKFGFSEDIWPFESIKKDYCRHMVPHRVRILPEIINKMDDYFMLKLSDLGTFTTFKQKQHENNFKEG
jgi:hypothetical protein